MSPIHLDVHSVPREFSDARVITEDELFGLKVKQLRTFEEQSDGLFFDLFTALKKVLDDLEVDVLVLDQHRLNLMQIFHRVNTENLVQKVVVSI